MAYLLLENGMVFEGTRIGAPFDAAGELVFETGVVGYMETLTNPANAGLLVVQTFPSIGNYGVEEEDEESPYTPAGYVVRTLCDTPSNFRSSGSLGDYLLKKGIPGIAGVDTRRLTAVLREEGSMAALLCDTLPEKPAFSGKKVSLIPCAPALYPAKGTEKAKVCLWDLGSKKSLIENMTAFGWAVETLPFDAKAEDILRSGADAAVISGGPGNPEDYAALLPEIEKLTGRIPLLCAGMGHVLCALALGGEAEKMHTGHQGQNQPVYSTLTGCTLITCQNHRHAVIPSSLKGKADPVFLNLNDHSCEGFIQRPLRCLSVQFDPDGKVFSLFEQLMMGGEKHA